MKNQDMPANAQNGFTDGNTSWCSAEIGGSGETKYEKAFWMMFSEMAASATNLSPANCEELARLSVNLTDAGFKALEDKIKLTR